MSARSERCFNSDFSQCFGMSAKSDIIDRCNMIVRSGMSTRCD